LVICLSSIPNLEKVLRAAFNFHEFLVIRQTSGFMISPNFLCSHSSMNSVLSCFRELSEVALAMPFFESTFFTNW
jgi:hypothetical protein